MLTVPAWVNGTAFTEMAPLKAAMLVKTWQGQLQEVDQKVGVVPELGKTSVGVKRFGPELERRTRCKRQFEQFYEAAFGLAIADKSEDPAARRALLPSLYIAGEQYGPKSAVYASLSSPAAIALVDRDDEWSVLALAVNPTERDMATIVTAERTALSQLCGLAADAGCSLRVFADVESTLAGSGTELNLSPFAELWFRCDIDEEGGDKGGDVGSDVCSGVGGSDGGSESGGVGGESAEGGEGGQAKVERVVRSPPPSMQLRNGQTKRRTVLAAAATVASAVAGGSVRPALASAAAAGTEWRDPRWDALGLRGTAVTLRTVEAAAQAVDIGQMGLYPDPLLRRIGSPVTTFGPSVESVAQLLVAGMKSNAITALQYGIDARMIAVRGPASPTRGALVYVNPTILSRSAEEQMVSWREFCLVLPPALEVELLRDAVVEVAAQDVYGVPFRKTLRGEAARAFQHELDHLDGILILDHAGLDELPSDVASLERSHHDARQRRAFARRVYEGETLYY